MHNARNVEQVQCDVCLKSIARTHLESHRLLRHSKEVQQQYVNNGYKYSSRRGKKKPKINLW